MYDLFDLPVTYRNETLMLPAQLVQTGYTHGFRVDIDGHEFIFEPDEEGIYRALAKPDEIDGNISTDLLQAVAEAIGKVLQ